MVEWSFTDEESYPEPIVEDDAFSDVELLPPRSDGYPLPSDDPKLPIPGVDPDDCGY